MKKKTLRSVTLLLAIAMTFSLVACAPSTTGGTSTTASTVASTTADSNGNYSYTFRLATIQGDDTPVGMAANKLGERINAELGGRVKIEVFNNSLLGTETEIRDALSIGTIETALIGQSLMTGKVDEANITLCYFTLTDNKLADWFYEESELGTELKTKYLAATGVRPLATNYRSMFRFFLCTKPWTTPEEFKGMKVRVPAGSPIYEDLVSAMGGMPVSLSLAECYTSLQQGVIQGLELPPSLHVSNSYYDMCKYMMMTYHMSGTNFFYINDECFQKLTPEDQQLLTKIANEVGVWETEKEIELSSGYIETLKSKGVQLVDVDIPAFIEAVQPVYNDRRAKWGDKWFDQIAQARIDLGIDKKK